MLGFLCIIGQKCKITNSDIKHVSIPDLVWYKTQLDMLSRDELHRLYKNDFSNAEFNITTRRK